MNEESGNQIAGKYKEVVCERLRREIAPKVDGAALALLKGLGADATWKNKKLVNKELYKLVEASLLAGYNIGVEITAKEFLEIKDSPLVYDMNSKTMEGRNGQQGNG